MYCRHVVSLGLLLWSPLLARADSFAEGDACVVTVKEASLQRGDELLVRIPNGTRLKVERVREGWVRTRCRSVQRMNRCGPLAGMALELH